MFERIGKLFDQGALAIPAQFIEVPLARSVDAYHAVAAGTIDKIVLAP